jgi:translocation and assembly module TamB
MSQSHRRAPLASDRPRSMPPEVSDPHFVRHPEPSRPHGVKRVLKVVGAVVGTTATVLVAMVGGTLLHINLPAARRVLSGGLNTALAGSFKGEVHVERMGSFGLGGFDGVVATVKAPDGKRVLLLDGVRARVSLPRAAWSAIAGKGDIIVALSELRIDHVDALIEQEADGTLTIQRAFEPRETKAADPNAPKGRGLDLSLPHIDVRHAWVHGGIAALPVIDAELHELDGAFGLTPQKTQLDLRRFRLNTRSMPSNANPDGVIEAHLVLPAASGADLGASLAFVGAIGGIAARVNGAIDGQKVDATVDVPRAEAEAIRAMVAGAPIYQPVGAHLEAHGTLPTLAPTATITIGGGQVDLGGQVTIADAHNPDTRADVTIDARGIDARAFSPTGPASNVSAHVVASAALKPGNVIDGKYDLHVLPGDVAAQAIPDTRVRGAFALDQGKAATAEVTGSAHVSEPGAPLELTFALHQDATAGTSVDFDTRVVVADLRNVKRLGGFATGHATVHTKGKVQLATQRVDARVEAQVNDFDTNGTKVEHLTLAALVNGPLARPNVDANVAGSGLQAGGFVYPVFAVTAQGPATDPFVAAKLHSNGSGPDVEVQATIHTADVTAVDDIELGLSRKDVKMHAHVGRLSAKGGALDVEGVHVEGLGEPLTASLHMRPGSAKITAKSTDLAAVKIATLLGLEEKLNTGEIGLDVDLAMTGATTTGHASVDVTKAMIPGLNTEGDVHLRADFAGHQVKGKVDASVATVGDVSLKADELTLAGPALEGRSWVHATGHVALDTDLDLAKVQRAMPPETAPVSELSGHLTVNGEARLEHRSGLPDLALHVATKDLSATTKPSVVANADGTVTRLSSPQHVEGIDLDFKGTIEGEDGASQIDARLFDKVGTIVEASVSGKAPLADIDAKKAPLAELLAATPIKARVNVPMRAMNEFPASLGKSPVIGKVGLTLDATGTMRAPRVLLNVRGDDLRDINKRRPVPVSVAAALSYDGEDARLQLIATRPEGKVLDGTGDVRVKVTDVLDHKGNDPLPWEASAAVRFAKFPVEAFADLAKQNVSGDLSGSVEVKDLHRAASLDASFDVTKLRVNGARFPHATAALSMKDGALKASARVEQKDGFADVRATTSFDWGEDVTPQVDVTKPVDVAIKAQNFRLAAVAPLLESVFSELDGRMNADAKLHADPGGKTGKMEGAIVLDKVIFESPALGEEFHNVHARLIMNPWGTWRFDQISAEGLTGKMTAEGTAQVNGLTFKQAQASIRIAQNDKIPISLQGVSMGTAWGAIDTKVVVAEDGKSMGMDVDIPSLHIDLPQSVGHSVQPLDADPNIKLGVHEPDGRLAVLPITKPEKVAPKGEATPVRIAVKLGRDIVVKRDTTLKVAVVGGVVVETGDETKMSGVIQAPEGFIEVNGKKFKIEKATVNFTGQETGNPVVIATAFWDSGDDVRVYADFVGPVKSGKLTLRSEPQLSQNEILSLLLFGSASGTFGQPAQGNGSETDAGKAAGVAGGVMTQGLNKAISGVSNVEVTTRVDTSQSQNPRPQVEVQLSKEVTAQVTYNLGVPPPGQNPDKTMLTVDWRFVRNWVAESTLGDKGTSIFDLIWKYRY